MATLVGNIRGPQGAGITGVTVSDTAPSDPQVGDVWIDTSLSASAGSSDTTSDTSSDTASESTTSVSEATS